MKRILHALTILLLLFCASGCSYDKYAELHPSSTVVVPDTIKRTISYKNDIVRIMTANCYSCHDAANFRTLAPGYELDTYTKLHFYATPANSNATVIRSLNHDPSIGQPNFMPYNLPQLPDSMIQIFEKWVADGAPNN